MLQSTTKHQDFKKGWKKGSGDIIYENPQYGRVQATMNCKEDGSPRYDQILFIEPSGGAIIVPIDEPKKRIYLHSELRPAVLKPNAPEVKAGNLEVDLRNLGRESVEVPRGFIDAKDASSLQAAAREATEEMGIAVSETDFQRLGEINADTAFFTSSVSVYLLKVNAKDKAKELSEEEREKIQSGRWYGIGEVKKMIRENTIFCALTLAALNLAFQHFDNG